MKCPQCESTLIEPNGFDKYCEECCYPDDNLAVFTLVEIKAYLRSMFKKQSCVEDIKLENFSLACAYNLLTDENSGITAFCQKGKAEGLTMSDFSHVKI